MDTYSLSRNFFNWCFENPEKISPNHVAIYFFAIEHCNRLGGREKFGFPTMMACDALGIKKPATYIKYFNDLEKWGFIKVYERAKNQYSANIISLKNALPKKGEALDKAMLNHRDKQTKSMGKSKVPIIKQLTTKQLNNIDSEIPLVVKKQFVPPTIDEVKKYFDENGYSENSANSFFKYYSVADWKDSKGNSVKNWKQKAIAVWFKPENAKPVQQQVTKFTNIQELLKKEQEALNA